jgi:ubiquinone biosynthesis protein
MGILIKSEHLRRYKDIAKLLLKHGFFGLAREMGLETLIDRQQTPEVRATQQGEELARDLEKMGPTFVKLGQLLSTRPDILPVEYTTALERLQSDVAGFPYEQVREIVESEFGMPLDGVFLEFDPRPLAAASIGQVHRATLHDGASVAVKLQRPGISDHIMADLELLEDIAEFLQQNSEIGEIYHVREVFREFETNLLQELGNRSAGGPNQGGSR